MNKLLYKKMGIDENFIFKIEKCPLEHEFLSHTHDFWELVIILEGTAIHVVNDREYDLRRGDTFIIHNNVSHGYKRVRGLSYINIIFHPSMLTELLELKKMKGFQALFFIEPNYRMERSFSGNLVQTPLQLKKVETITDILIEEYREMNEGYKTMIISTFTGLLVTLSRNYITNVSEESHKILLMAEAVAYMEENYQEAITIKQLAQLAGLSERHFTRIFKKNYKRTPIDYIIKLRLDHAARLLRENNLSISAVALECGFNDHNYFSRQFKKTYGVAPSEFIK